MNSSPVTQSYSEEFPGKGIPLDRLEPFTQRARAAGAPDSARLRIEEVPGSMLTPFGGTRVRITWAYREEPQESAEPDGADEDVKGCPAA